MIMDRWLQTIRVNEKLAIYLYFYLCIILLTSRVSNAEWLKIEKEELSPVDST